MQCAWGAREVPAAKDPPAGTSATHPFRVRWIVPGAVAVCVCPGKRVTSAARREHWRRDVRADLAAMAGMGVGGVLCLLDVYELRTLGVDAGAYAAGAQAAGLRVWRHPLIEGSCPRTGEEAAALRALLDEVVASGLAVAVHCRAGRGRAGMVAACLLLLRGEAATAADAMAAVRAVRKGAIETRRQEDFVRHFAATRSGR